METHRPLMKWLGGEQKRFCLHWPSFILAFAVGLLYVFIAVPQKEKVVKHPTPFNAGSVTYKDDAGTCFVYKAKNVECPPNPSHVTQQPILVAPKEE